MATAVRKKNEENEWEQENRSILLYQGITVCSRQVTYSYAGTKSPLEFSQINTKYVHVSPKQTVGRWRYAIRLRGRLNVTARWVIFIGSASYNKKMSNHGNVEKPGINYLVVEILPGGVCSWAIT